MKMIVGLGNPGRRYCLTPHNVGYDVVDELAARHALKWADSRRVDAQVAKGRIGSASCILVKPTTYMNLSGEAVAPLLRKDGSEKETDLLVILDDAALPVGRLRMRAEGSSGSHRGLESIIGHLGGGGFCRLRCGVAPEGDRGDLAEYVLGRWPKDVRPAVEAMVMRAADAAEEWLKGDVVAVMNRYNVRND